MHAGLQSESSSGVSRGVPRRERSSGQAELTVPVPVAAAWFCRWGCGRLPASVIPPAEVRISRSTAELRRRLGPALRRLLHHLGFASWNCHRALAPCRQGWQGRGLLRGGGSVLSSRGSPYIPSAKSPRHSSGIL